MHHGATFSFGSPEVCSPAIFETCFSYDIMDIGYIYGYYGLLQLIIKCTFT